MKPSTLVILLLVLALIVTAGGSWIAYENLAADNAQLATENQRLRSGKAELVKHYRHFTIANGWTGKPHVRAVKELGVEVCFDECHAEKSCSDCHVNLNN